MLSVFCHVPRTASSATWPTASSTPAARGSSALKMLSWGEFHTRDRDFIYLKIDGKSFQAQAIFAKTALWDPEKRSGKIQMHTAPSSSPEGTFTRTQGGGGAGRCLQHPQRCSLPQDSGPSALFLALPSVPPLSPRHWIH